MINWQLFATLMAPILALVVGRWVNDRFESRPILLTYWGHFSSFNFQDETGTVRTIHTHSIIIRNAGKRPASNVRVSHSHLPTHFQIWPPTPYNLEEVPNSGRDIVFPTVIPKQEFSIAYLYFPPVTYANVNNGVRCDEGFATPIPVLLQQQHPRWVTRCIAALVITGIATLFYGLVQIGSWIINAMWN